MEILECNDIIYWFICLKIKDSFKRKNFENLYLWNRFNIVKINLFYIKKINLLIKVYFLILKYMYIVVVVLNLLNYMYICCLLYIYYVDEVEVSGGMNDVLR